MTDRTKSAAPSRKKSSSPHNGEASESHETSRKHKSPKSPSTLDNRPEWNNDTKIEGYDDVDENGRYRRHGGTVNRLKSQVDQDEMNQAWLNSLRGDYHDRRKPARDND